MESVILTRPRGGDAVRFYRLLVRLVPLSSGARVDRPPPMIDLPQIPAHRPACNFVDAAGEPSTTDFTVTTSPFPMEAWIPVGLIAKVG